MSTLDNTTNAGKWHSSIVAGTFAGLLSLTVSGTASPICPNTALEKSSSSRLLQYVTRTNSKKKWVQNDEVVLFNRFGVLDEEEIMYPTRVNTATELIVGELREWLLLDSDWDGEGALKPLKDSIAQTVGFVKLLDSTYYFPEPMLHSTGRAGLYWNEDDLYADLEFTGNKVTYFIKKAGHKYKGAVDFNATVVPPIFQELLQVPV